MVFPVETTTINVIAKNVGSKICSEFTILFFRYPRGSVVSTFLRRRPVAVEQRQRDITRQRKTRIDRRSATGNGNVVFIYILDKALSTRLKT